MPHEGVKKFMKRKTNFVKRNSGFIVACVIVAAASFIIVDAGMSGVFSANLSGESTDESEGMELTVKKSAPEDANEVRTYETDAFTVTASGRIRDGVETETESEEELVETETDENGDVIEVVTVDGGEEIIVEEIPPDGEGTSSDYGDEETYAYDYDSYDSGEESYEAYAQEEAYGGYAGAEDDYGAYDGYSEDYYYDDNGRDGYSGSDGWVPLDSDGNVTIWEYNPYADTGSYGGGGSGGSSGSGVSPTDGSGDSGTTEEEPDTIIPGISSRYISVEELYPYTKEELRFIRYEIYALHGRIFMSDDLAEYFDSKSWYVPRYMPDEFDDRLSYFLNDYELANLQTIRDYEAALDG